MQAKIILRHVGAPAAHFVNLLMAVGNNVNARADSISPRGKGANKKRIAASAKVFQQRWRFTHIDDGNKEIVVINMGELPPVRKFFSSDGASPILMTTISSLPSLSRSPTARPRDE